MMFAQFYFTNMQPSQQDDSEIFSNTNPKLQLKRHYKIIKADSAKASNTRRPYNIFDLSDPKNQLMTKIQNPQSFPLGGERFLKAMKVKTQNLQKKQLIQNLIESRKHEPTIKDTQIKPQSLLPSKSLNPSQEQYKTHSRSLASSHNSRNNSRKLTSATNAPQPLKRKALSAASGFTNRQTRFEKNYDHYQKQYFQKIGVEGYLQFKQPLEKRYGDKFFEYTLRDRYKDQDKRTRAFLFQVQKGDQEIMNSSKSFHSVANRNGYKVRNPQYMQVVGVNKSNKERYSSCFK